MVMVVVLLLIVFVNLDLTLGHVFWGMQAGLGSHHLLNMFVTLISTASGLYYLTLEKFIIVLHLEEGRGYLSTFGRMLSQILDRVVVLDNSELSV